MIFTVVWDSTSLENLADVWMNSPVPNQVTHAAQQIDEVLRQDPQNVGEALSNGERIEYRAPLGFRFAVNEDDRIVSVRAVWHI